MSDNLFLLITLLDTHLKTTYKVSLKTKISLVSSEVWYYWQEPKSREALGKIIGRPPGNILHVEKIDDIVVLE